MTSRTYRDIRIVFFLLLVITCLLVSRAAPTSSTRRTKRSSGDRDNKVYAKLSKALVNQKYSRKYLKELQTSAKCPFRVLNAEGFTRVLCDFSKCTSDNNSCDQDCQQAYMKATDINPKRRPRRKKVTSADVEVGCIYIPRRREHSIETAGPETVKRVV